MGTTAEKLQGLIDSKEAIKSAIERNGVTVGDAKLSDYAGKISEIPDGMNGFLSVEYKTFAKSASQTVEHIYNKKCGIYDENGKKWDTLEWHQRWVDNGYSAIGLSKPTGIWMNAFGQEDIYLWPLTVAAGYSDVTGTAAVTTNTFQHFINGQGVFTAATAADRTVWPANQSGNIAHGTAGKYKSATFRTRTNGVGLDLICDNTGETFTMPSRNIGAANAFERDDSDDIMWGYYKMCEFCRALFAICSGISTTEGDGAVTTVEILNTAGQQAAVGEDMYFWIGGNNTGLKAKYNLNSLVVATGNSTSGLLTQAIADAIYNKQKENGVNMNDTGVNSATKHVLLPGMKGAEAIAVDGYWYIKTPFISTPNGTTFNTTNNQADAPIIYLCKHKGVILQSGMRTLPYSLNIATHIAGITNLLRNTEGMSADVPDRYIGAVWLSTFFTGAYEYFLITNYRMIYRASYSQRYGCIPCPSITFY